MHTNHTYIYTTPKHTVITVNTSSRLCGIEQCVVQTGCVFKGAYKSSVSVLITCTLLEVGVVVKRHQVFQDSLVDELVLTL